MERMHDSHFKLEMSVRDYECDLQGIVNNAVYQNYLEHSRHEFLRSLGCSFSQMHLEGIDLVVTRIEIDFKYSLRSEDHFLCLLKCSPYGKIRIVFWQQIIHIPTNKICIDAKVYGTGIKNGKIVSPLVEIPNLAPFLNPSDKMS